MLPDSVLQAAFVPASGEYAWRKRDLAAAVQAVADAGLLILGGEAWIVRDGGFAGLIPLRDGTLSVFHWEPELPSHLPWDDAVHAAAEYTLNVIADLGVEDEAADEFARDVWYCLSFVTRDEHEPLTRRSV